MPKYYIKIDKNRYIINSKTYIFAIQNILKKHKINPSPESIIYISESGFDGNKWTIVKLKSILGTTNDY